MNEIKGAINIIIDEENGEIELANGYRRKALVDIEKDLKEDIGGYKKLEYLYLAANYKRQFGNSAKSDAYVGALEVAIKELKDDMDASIEQNINEMIDDRNPDGNR